MADTVSETYIYDLPSTVSPLAAGDKIIIEKASGGTKAMTYTEFIKAVAASMVTNAGTVTDDIHSVSGKQLNPNVSGTLAASIASLNSSVGQNQVRCKAVTISIPMVSIASMSNLDTPSVDISGYIENGTLIDYIVVWSTGSAIVCVNSERTGNIISPKFRNYNSSSWSINSYRIIAFYTLGS